MIPAIFAAVGELAGLGPSDATVRGVVRWPERRVLLSDDDQSSTYREAGWVAVKVGSSLQSTVQTIWQAAGHTPAPAMLPRSVAAMCQRLGVTTPPHASGDGRLLRWEHANVMLVLGGARRSGEPGTVFHLHGTTAQAVTQLHAACLVLVAHGTSQDAMNPSSHEGRMMKALLAAGLPPADRGVELKTARGRVYSKPDFAWPDVRLLLDLDGWYHHCAPAVDLLLEAPDRDVARKTLVLADRTRFERDAHKRRLAAIDGWTVVTCTDTEIDRDGPGRIAAQVASVYRRLAMASERP